MPENFLEINPMAILRFDILGFSLAGKRRVHGLIFSSIG